MERRACPPGSQWDSLLKHCISHRSLGLTPSGLDESWSSISPSVWICVGLVVSVSVLVLLLWFIIYRLQTLRLCAIFLERREEEAPSPWPHFNGQTQEMPIKEGPCGRSLCNGWAEHGLPLPATELGNSALVTTKTGQPV
uniref:Tumor necrosis factor receptor superfamily member 13C-like n=1 Tax=Sinocyclocheilus rhinocerous TaxID=307959 RepID=A0A673JF23_9TELE